MRHPVGIRTQMLGGSRGGRDVVAGVAKEEGDALLVRKTRESAEEAVGAHAEAELPVG